jgi:hypothetical protein
MTEIKAAVTKLSSISHTNNAASDDLTAALSEIETTLNGFAPGVSAWVRLCTPEDENGTVEDIGYGKHDGKWCLLWARYRLSDPDESWRQKPLLESPREVRRQSVKMLPELLNALVHEAEISAKKTVEASLKARDVLVELKRG